jgi:hypothetical protein
VDNRKYKHLFFPEKVRDFAGEDGHGLIRIFDAADLCLLPVTHHTMKEAQLYVFLTSALNGGE